MSNYIIYDEMKRHTFTAALITNRYFGDTVKCEIAYFKGRLYAVHPFGYHRLHDPDRLFTSIDEAQWYLINHPDYKNIRLIIGGHTNE